jgi:hypothetical protein
MYKINMELEEHFQKYNKLNGHIKRYFRKNTRKEVKLRMINVVAKPAVENGSE